MIYCFSAYLVLQLFLTHCSTHEHCADRTHLHPMNHRAASPVTVIFIATIFTTEVWKWLCEPLTFILHLHQGDTESPVAHMLCLKKAVEKWEPMALQQPAETSEETKITEQCHVVKEFTPELQCRKALDFLLQHKTYYFVQVIWITIIIKYSKQTSIQKNKAED